LPGRDLRHKLRPISVEPIGIIRSPFKKAEGAPIQSVSAKHARGVIEILPNFVRGLDGLTEFSHLILIYRFHKARKSKSLLVKPYLDGSKDHGVFSTRSPARPSLLGISIVRQLGISGGKIRVADVDVIDGTPLLDIKPYVPQFDSRETEKIGWYAGKLRKLSHTVADDRFSK
jgi:tRNA (adenine37-N6)-methyltransferase